MFVAVVVVVVVVAVFAAMILATAAQNEPLDVFDAIHCLMMPKMQPNDVIRMHFSIVA